MLLETYSAHEKQQLLELLPQFLNIEKEVTGNPDYSMFNLSLKEDWNTSKLFCRDLSTAGQFYINIISFVIFSNIQRRIWVFFCR